VASRMTDGQSIDRENATHRHTHTPVVPTHTPTHTHTSGSAKDLGDMMAHPVPHSPRSILAPRFAHSLPGDALLRVRGG
jgi:hypothetical protein